jgi:diguanylate cyclase (GGDEF)-like protein
LYGIPASRALGRVTDHLLETEFPEDFDVIRKKLLEDGRWEGLIKQTDAWGNRRIVMSRWAHNIDEIGEEFILEINSDVTSAHEAESRRRTAEALFEIAFNHAPNGVGVIGAGNGARGRWLQANDALRELTPTRRDPVGEPVAAMFDAEDAPPVMRQLGELFNGRCERWAGEWRVPTRGGGHRYLAAQCIAIAREDSDGERIVVVQLEDITRRRAHENWLLGQAVQDSLTELPNRLAINELLESEISALSDHGRPLAVLFVDLDGFKAVNDQFGHAAGDDVLIEVARRLRENAPENATVGRLGGDEFVVLAPDHDEAAAAKLSRNLRETTVIPAGDGPDALVVTASIGWASTADPSIASGALLGRADAMMYEFKNTNRRALSSP